MLTMSDLITVLALCATFYGLGYVHGQFLPHRITFSAFLTVSVLLQ